jgi:cytoskeletal protein CcmA (bactofilin family)
VDSCSECRALLRALELETKRLSQALLEADETVPARLLAPPTRGRTPWGWIVTFGLASAGAYTVWTGLDQVRQQLGIAGFGEGNLFTTLLFSGVFWKGWANMANFIEILAVTTLGILAFGLWRRFSRRSTTLAVIMAGLTLALGLPQGAAAAEVKRVQSYVLSKDETIHNDLIVFGANTRIDGTVDGDLISFGQKLIVNGHVTGDVIGFAQTLAINGHVDGNIRVFSNFLTINGTVGKNASVFGQSLDFDSAARIGGGFMAFAGQATLDGRVGRDLMFTGGQLTLGSFVGGNVLARFDRLSVSSTAETVGKSEFKGHRTPEVDPHAKFGVPFEFVMIERGKTDYTQFRFYLHQAFFWGAAFLFGLVLILIAPDFFSGAVNATRQYALSLGVGFAAFVGVPILAIIACVTVVGLGVGIASVLLWVVALYASQTFISVWLGDLLLQRSTSKGGVIGRLALGLLIFRVAFQIPYLGSFVKFVVIFWGLGALALGLFRKRHADLLPAAAPSPAV